MSLRLLLQRFYVKGVEFSGETAFENGILSINRDELRALLEEDPTFSKVEIELAHPGQSVRILQVADIVEPRARRDGGDFPGILNPTVTMTGNGVTDVLSGSAVVLIDQCGNNCSIMHDAIGNTITMSGPGAEISTYGRTHNICVIPHAADGVDPTQAKFRIASKAAAVKAAVYLAQACRNLQPDDVEVYELPPLAEASKGLEGLPKVVYIFNFYRYYLEGEFAIYGDTYPWLPSVLMHPNEFFDGAVVNPYLNANFAAPGGVDTYSIQNHAIIHELYRRHGKDLNFLGVIPVVARLMDAEVASQTNIAIKLAYSLGADGIILTKAPGGSPQVDVAQTAIKAQELGMKAVLVIDDIAARSPDGKVRATGIIFNDVRASAIVNTGNLSEIIKLPPVESTIGHCAPGAEGQLNRVRSTLLGQGGQLGGTHTIEVEY